MWTAGRASFAGITGILAPDELRQAGVKLFELHMSELGGELRGSHLLDARDGFTPEEQ